MLKGRSQTVQTETAYHAEEILVLLGYVSLQWRIWHLAATVGACLTKGPQQTIILINAV